MEEVFGLNIARFSASLGHGQHTVQRETKSLLYSDDLVAWSLIFTKPAWKRMHEMD